MNARTSGMTAWAIIFLAFGMLFAVAGTDAVLPEWAVKAALAIGFLGIMGFLGAGFWGAVRPDRPRVRRTGLRGLMPGEISEDLAFACRAYEEEAVANGHVFGNWHREDLALSGAGTELVVHCLRCTFSIRAGHGVHTCTEPRVCPGP